MLSDHHEESCTYNVQLLRIYILTKTEDALHLAMMFHRITSAAV